VQVGSVTSRKGDKTGRSPFDHGMCSLNVRVYKLERQERTDSRKIVCLAELASAPIPLQTTYIATI
jgi:hypothetical protein